MARGAENIGFAIPINSAKRAISQVIEKGKISYPFLGVCWLGITPEIKKALNLSVDYGALILKGRNCQFAIVPNSAAQKAGLKERDIILEWNGIKLKEENNLGKVIQKHNPGDKILLKILRDKNEFNVFVILGERNE
jgi:S1-C subfamily serine protease